MFKYIAIGLALFAAGSNGLNVRHEADAINVAALTDAQKAADTFFRSKIPNLSGATLSGGEQDGKTFRFQYINQNIPVTLSQMSADRVDETNNKFKLLEALQSVTGPVQGGRMTQVSKTYGIESFDKALENLGWK